MMPTFQLYNQHPDLDRTKHVWKQKGLVQENDGRTATLYKCLLCGALSTRPDDDSLPQVYGRLTDTERNLVQPRLKAIPVKGNE